MIVPIPDVVRPETVQRVLAQLATTAFTSGLETGGPDSVGIKTNLQIPAHSQTRQELSALVREELLAHVVFQQTAWPLRVSLFHFSRYQTGMHYGEHIDEPIMNRTLQDQFRSDISMTLFLSDPASYQGGELVINTDGVALKFKLPAGHVLLYPATSLHRVEPVTDGERIVVVGWIQSFIRSAERRLILWDMTRALDLIQLTLPKEECVRHPLYITAKKIRANLLRLWYEG